MSRIPDSVKQRFGLIERSVKAVQPKEETKSDHSQDDIELLENVPFFDETLNKIP